MAALIRIFTLSLCFVMLSWTVAQGIPYRPNNLLASLQTSGKCNYCMVNCWLWLVHAVGMTCAGAGHRNGCCKGGIHACAVVVGGTVVCYCDEGCHAVGQCCSDIRTIGCIRMIAPPPHCAAHSLVPPPHSYNMCHCRVACRMLPLEGR